MLRKCLCEHYINQWNHYQATARAKGKIEQRETSRKKMMCIQISMPNINFAKILFFSFHLLSFRLVRFYFLLSFVVKLRFYSFFFSFSSFFEDGFVYTFPLVIIYLLVYIISHMLFAKCAYFFIFPHVSTWTGTSKFCKLSSHVISTPYFECARIFLFGTVHPHSNDL